MKPYKAKPVLKERIWGGQKLKQYNKCFESSNIGESWETDKDSMPVLIKLIDAKDKLSVQVHPNNKFAWELEKQLCGKSEGWIVLDCEEGAELVAGLKAGTNREMLEEAIKNGNIKEYLNITKVKRGDCIYIPAGTVHSLGSGMLVYEVQQPSDITYRLYDWDRTDSEGNPRQLHIENALKCIDYDLCSVNIINLYDQDIKTLQKHTIFQYDYFTTTYINFEFKQQLDFNSICFTAITCISGSGRITHEESKELMKKGDTWIVPENCQINLQAYEKLELIITEHYQSIK